MKFKRNLLSSSIAIAISGNAMPVLAEEDQGEQALLEEIVVTGIRGSLKRSMDIKRDAMGVVDAISAEELGKFPDANLAESLQRITGVSISRERGEGSQVTVRGFGPEYNLVTLNGRQMPTHNGVTRSFDFGDLASEGVAGVQVYKTGRADIPSGGVGSTINISTPRPLEAEETASIAVKMVRDTSTRRGDDVTPEFSGIYLDRFADDTIGIAITATNQTRNNGVNGASTGGWFTRAGDGFSGVSATGAELFGDVVVNDANQVNRPQDRSSTYSIPQSMAYNIAEYETERTNGQIVLQWAPTDTVTATAEYIYSEFLLERSYNDMSAWFSNVSAVSQTSEWTSEANASPVFYTEAVNFADFAMGSGEDGRLNENNSIALNIEWQVTDDLVLEVDYHDSSAETGANGPNGTSSLITIANFNKVEQTIVTGFDMPVMLLDLNSGGEASRPMYANDMIITGSVFRNDASRMDIEQARASGTWDISDNSSIDFGVQMTEVKNRAVSNFTQLNAWGGISDPGEIADIVVRSTIDGQFDELSGSDYPGLQTEFFAADLPDLQTAGEAVFASGRYDYSDFGSGVVGDCGTYYCASSTIWPDDKRTTEETQSAYVRLNWAGDIAGMPANLHTGVRWEETDVVSAVDTPIWEGSSWTGGGNEVYITQAVDADGNIITAFEPFDGNYDLLLPSLDFDIEVVENVVLRFSYSETITRPSYDDIKGGLTVNGGGLYYTNTGSPNASGGNPGLVPIQSENIDLSLEWYYADSSYFSIGYFEKDVDNFIGNSVEGDTLFDIPNVIGGQLYNQAVEESGLDATDFSAVHQFIVDNYQDNPAVDGDTILGVEGDPLVVLSITRPVNQQAAKVDGIEINLQHTFGDTGFGFIANATMADANVGYDYTNPWQGQFVLNGLSDSANLIAFYDKEQLQVRVAYNWRDDFLAGVGQGQGTLTNPTNVKAYGQLDVGVTYNATENLTIYFSGLNITEETVHVYGLTESQVLQAVQGGPRYDLGIRYTL